MTTKHIGLALVIAALFFTDGEPSDGVWAASNQSSTVLFLAGVVLMLAALLKGVDDS